MNDRRRDSIVLCWIGAMQFGCAGVGSLGVKDAVLVLDCEDGQKEPLVGVPKSEWPSTVEQGLTAVRDLWRGPVNALLRCSDAPDQDLKLLVQVPDETKLVRYTPPTALPPGASGYDCLNAVGGQGLVTVEGLSVDLVPRVIQNEPFGVAIKTPGNTILVEGFETFQISGPWQTLDLFYGIYSEGKDGSADGGAALALYGNVIFSRQEIANGRGSGQSMDCRMTDFVLSARGSGDDGGLP